MSPQPLLLLEALPKSAIILAYSLVSSKIIEYCNSLYIRLPSIYLSRLQHVQNSLSRVVIPSVKRTDHIQPVLQRLHWLPVSQRITYKIALLTFKALFLQRTFLPFWAPYTISTCLQFIWCLRSSNQQLFLSLLRSHLLKKRFTFAAPTVWNSLPLHLRLSSSVHSFRSQLKTHLYPP